jgi:predicted alpha/beta hydrolase family esterase
MRQNTEWIVQFHSPIDPLIPVEEGRFVANKLQSEYIELQDAGHFIVEQVPEVIKIIEDKCHNKSQ